MAEVRRHRLANGLTLLLQEAHEAPVVALQAWVQVGAADELPPVLGVAHLHEHMLFKGTARRPVGALARQVEAAGGEINAWTSFDQTVYHIVLARQEMATGIDILADALRASSFDPAELAREIEVVLEEIRRAEDTPTRRAANALFALAYGEHPYARPVLGSAASVRAMTREQILAFYRQYYRPDNVTFVAVGDFDAAALVAAVEAHLGSWQAPPAALRRPPRPAVPAGVRPRARVLAEDVKEGHLALAWPGPRMDDPDLAVADALAVVLGGGEASRLYAAVRRDQGLVNDVYAYAYTPREPGLWMAGAGVPAERLRAALAAIAEQAYALMHAPVGVAELDRARILILADSARARETVQGQARQLAHYETLTGDYAFEARYLAALAELTPADLQAYARRLLVQPPVVVAQLPAAAAAGLDAAELATICEDAAARAAARPRPKASRPGAAGVTRIALPGGATLLLRRESGPMLALRAVALGGQRWEAPAQAGISQLFAHVWGEGSERLAATAMAEQVAAAGGSLSAFAGRNSVGLQAEFVRERAQAGLGLFCEALLQPVFPAAAVARERDLICEAIRNRDDSPAAVAFELFAQAVHPAHPYGQPLLGHEATVAALTPADLQAYWQRFAAPQRLVIAAVGDVDTEALAEMLAAALAGPAAAPLAPPPAYPAAKAADRAPRRTLPRQQAHVVVGGVGSHLAAADRPAIEALTTILSGQGGRLFYALRDQQSLAYSVSAGATEGIDPGQIYVYIGTAPDKVEQALAGIYAHLQALIDTPVSAEELQRAQRYLTGTHAISLQRGGARAMTMALDERYGLGYDHHLGYDAAIAAVDAAAIQAAAAAYLPRARLVEAMVGPAAA